MLRPYRPSGSPAYDDIVTANRYYSLTELGRARGGSQPRPTPQWGSSGNPQRVPSPTVTTILPICPSLSMYACASAIRSSGNGRSGPALSAPVATTPPTSHAQPPLQPTPPY